MKALAAIAMTGALAVGCASSPPASMTALSVKATVNGSYAFVDAQGNALTENEFVRRYRALTGSRELDEMERPRNGGTLVGAGVAFVLGASLATTTAFLCRDVGRCDVGVIGIPIGGVAALIGLVAFVDALTHPDGRTTAHYLTPAHARLYAERYNEELKARPAAAGHVRLTPLLAPGFAGLGATF